MTDSDPILLVHGAWHGAWCWTPLIQAFAASKRAAIALDLPGHGLNAKPFSVEGSANIDADAMAKVSPIAHIRFDDAVRAVCEMIGSLKSFTGRKTVLVAHSMGGVVATAAAEAMAEDVSAVVYVTSHMPVNGKAIVDYRTARENSASLLGLAQVGSPPQIGAIRIAAWDDAGRQNVKAALYHDVASDTAAAALRLLTSDLPIDFATSTVCPTQRWAQLRRSYIVCREDRALCEPLQRLYIRHANEAFPNFPMEVMELATSHSPFFSRPEKLAELIAACTP